jgi:protein-disulfide isomerase
MWQTKSLTVCFLICLFCLCKISAQEIQPGAESPYQFGNPNAKHKFEIFIDFQCGACATFGKKLVSLKKKYPNEILIVFRNFPLPIPAHDKAFLAAIVAESAGKQGKFWEMFDLLLQNQEKWSASASANELFVKYAKKLRLDVEVFKADLQSAAITERVNLDMARARSLNLSSTPTVILNGKVLSYEVLGNLERFILEDK